MSYLAPALLLATVGVLVLVYARLCWRQKIASINIPCLVLLIDGQENYLEGLLRLFFLWCQRRNSLWRLQVITERPSKVTLAILHYFFIPYSYPKVAPPIPEMSLAVQLPKVHCLDIREEKSLPGAWQRLEQVWRQNDLREGINKPHREEYFGS